MEHINAIIERAEDGTFCIHCENEIFSGMGKTVDEAKSDMLEQMAFYKETAMQEGFKYPDFLDKDFDIQYSLDAQSVIKYYIKAGIFSLASLSKITGINQKQLWAYTNGTKPRRAQAARIQNGLAALSKDLNAIFA